MNHSHPAHDQPDGMNLFRIVKSSSSKTGPRLGRLSLPSRNTIETPHYVGITSRGVIPHLSHDVARGQTDVKSVYVALEDFVERAPQRTPPILAQPAQDGKSLLQTFLALPENQVTLLGLRRSPPVASPTANTEKSLSICTSVGFQQISIEDYIRTTQALKPDIVIWPGDIPYGATEKPGWRRLEKMSSRTERWLKDLSDYKAQAQQEDEKFSAQIFASVLPVGRELQSLYIDLLADELRHTFLGIAIHDCAILPDLPGELTSRPCLSLSEPSDPHQLLREVEMGVDIATVPFISAATDAGIALSFSFAGEKLVDSGVGSTPLGVDLWTDEHAADLSPLVAGCKCYTCRKHHRAYLHHLLSAKEMLAWVLMQIHNLHTMDVFYMQIRESIDQGTFEENHKAFGRKYELGMPQKTGQGPRVRGYQYKSEGPGETKKNPKPYHALNDGAEKLAETQLPSPEVDSGELQDKGFAQPSDK